MVSPFLFLFRSRQRSPRFPADEVDVHRPQKHAPKEEEKKQISPWRIVEGDAKSIAKTIQKALEQSSEKRLTVEFRVFKSG